MFSATAELYDLIYKSFKDYGAESAKIATLVRQHHGAAARLLDVACGTGEHACHLRTTHGFLVDGVDLEPRFVELAGAKNPGANFSCADMVEFDLGRRYDAVLCLFSSIGYVVDPSRLRGALASMGRHVAPGGVLIVEPWFEPGAMQDGYVTCTTASDSGTTVCRMTHTEVLDRRSLLRFEYLIGTRGGLRHETEIHECGLFTRVEMQEAFRLAGYHAEYDEQGLTGRGLYVAKRAA